MHTVIGKCKHITNKRKTQLVTTHSHVTPPTTSIIPPHYERNSIAIVIANKFFINIGWYTITKSDINAPSEDIARHFNGYVFTLTINAFAKLQENLNTDVFGTTQFKHTHKDYNNDLDVADQQHANTIEHRKRYCWTTIRLKISQNTIYQILNSMMDTIDSETTPIVLHIYSSIPLPRISIHT